MNKNKQNPTDKTSKKDIQQLLIDGLKKLTSKFGPDFEKLTKEIEKASKKMAKTIAKELKHTQALIEDAGNGSKAETTAPKVKSKKDEAPAKSAKAATAKIVAKEPTPKAVQTKTKPAKEGPVKPESKKDNKTS
jgi:hypothetical protein